MKMIKLLLSLLVTLEIADGFLTYSAVGKDLVREANPLVSSIADSGSFVLLKIIGALLCALLLWLLYRRFPKISLYATYSLLIFYIAVVNWNLGILLRFNVI